MHGLSKQSTNFTGVGGQNAMAHQRMGDSYGFKSSNIQTGAGSQVGRKAGPMKSGASSIHGYAGRPVDALPRRDSQHIFVNGRIVSDRVLQHAVNAAYGETMPRGRYPALVLFVDADA